MRLIAKKSLGQHFLTDRPALRRIVALAGVCAQDTVIEIGPGKGDLTKLLLQHARKVIAVELDQRMVVLLRREFAGNDRLTLVHRDILETDLAHLAADAGKVKVVANIPYYITTPIIERIIASRSVVAAAYLTVQKEFAQRMAAPAGSRTYGAFSCFVQYYCAVRIATVIARGCFSPAPKVDSALIELIPHAHLPLDAAGEARLFQVIRAAFQQRRKTLRNSLRGRVSADQLARFLDGKKMGPGVRPEQLTLIDFIALSQP